MFVSAAIYLAPLFLSVATAMIVPIPNGPYGVSSVVMDLVDNARLDPYAPTPQPRRLLLSAFYPVGPITECKHYLAPYMPPATAAFFDQEYADVGVPNGTFEALQLSLCQRTEHESWTSPMSFPVVLFSPGLGASRLVYNAMAQSMSSQGYVVFTIDHPYDASVVEFPDGSIVTAADISDLEQIAAAVVVRADDTSFLIRELYGQHKLRLPRSLFDLRKGVTMYGHSLGGATAASAMLKNPKKIIAGVNLDGRLFGPVIDAGLDGAFMIMGHDNSNRTATQWTAIWPHLRGPKVELEIKGAEHGTFSDLPLLVDVLGLRARLPKEVLDLLGSVNGTRALDIVTTYVSALFRLARGEGPEHGEILKKPSSKFPEVQILGSEGF